MRDGWHYRKGERLSLRRHPRKCLNPHLRRLRRLVTKHTNGGSL
jgi:hypothetical protein